MSMAKDITGQRFGKLTAVSPTEHRKNKKVVWECKCDCGNTVYLPISYLTSGDTKSCGCLKESLEEKNLRTKYDSKRVDGVALQLFKDEKPRKDSSTGYRGVSRYLTRLSKEERYRAWITVKGKRYYKSGFLTPEEAYRIGRKELEEKYLPKNKPPLN